MSFHGELVQSFARSVVEEIGKEVAEVVGQLAEEGMWVDSYPTKEAIRHVLLVVLDIEEQDTPIPGVEEKSPTALPTTEQLVDKKVEEEFFGLQEDIAYEPMDRYTTSMYKVDRLILNSRILHYVRLRMENIATGETPRYI
jgi:hypothetical protein